MKNKKILPLLVLTLVNILPSANLPPKKVNAEPSDYINGVFQMWKYQDETENYFLGNSIFNLGDSTFALNNSICLNNDPTTNSLMIVLEFDTDLSPIDFNILKISTTIEDPSDPTNTITKNVNYDSLYDLSMDQLYGEDYYAADNTMFIKIETKGFNQYILNGVDKEKFFYVDIDTDTPIKITRFLMDTTKDCDGYYKSYKFKPHLVGDYIHSSKVYYSNDSYSFKSNISNPFTLEDLLSKIKAFDYGDNTQVTLNYEDFGYLDAIRNKKLGTYKVNIIAKDSNKNTSVLELSITLVDIIKPTINSIDGVQKIRIPVSECGDLGSSIDLNKYVSISDDYDTNLKLSKNTNSIIYNGLTSKSVSLQTSDSSGNTTTETFLVEFYDDIAPTISGETSLVVYPYEYKSAEDIVNKLFEISDNHLIKNSGIKNDTFTENYKNIGDYSFIIYAEDYEGNLTESTINVEVKDTEGPVFFINEVYLSLDTNNAYLSAPEMINLLIKNNQIKQKDYKIIEYVNETYNDNYQNPGEYDIVIACYDQDYHKELINVKLSITKAKAQNTSFFGKIGGFFANIFSKIGDFFYWLWQMIVSWFK